jgi:hypothetical protein
MSRILADIEKGAVVLIHDLPEAPTDPAVIPGHLVPAVTTFAERLGLEAEKLTGGEAGWVFDLLGHAVEAVSTAQGGEGHAQAGSAEAPAAEANGAPAQSESVAETEVSTDNPTGTVPAAGGASAEAAPAAAEAAPTGEASAAPDTSGIDAAIAKAQSGEWQAGGGSAA